MPGLSEVRVTLYDVFGYLLPGLVAFGAVTIFVWATVFPSAALHEPKLSSSEWIGVLLASYVLGHLVQAVANMAAPLRGRAQAALDWSPFDTEIACAVHVPPLSGNPTDAERDARARRIFELCDIAVSQKGTTADREMYQYREGFYRGLAASFVLGLVAVVVRAAVGGNALVGKTHLVTGGEYLLACVFLAVAASLAYHRYARFFEYKLHNTFGAFAVLAGLVELPRAEDG